MHVPHVLFWIWISVFRVYTTLKKIKHTRCTQKMPISEVISFSLTGVFSGHPIYHKWKCLTPNIFLWWNIFLHLASQMPSCLNEAKIKSKKLCLFIVNKQNVKNMWLFFSFTLVNCYTLRIAHSWTCQKLEHLE